MKLFIKHERFYPDHPGTVEAINRAYNDPEFVNFIDSYLLTHGEAKELGYGDPFPRGGKTTVSAYIGDRLIDESIAHCSIDDNFCKRLGRVIALGRLKKKMNLQNV